MADRILKEITGYLQFSSHKRLCLVGNGKLVDIEDWMANEVPGVGKYVKVTVKEVPGE